MNWPMMPLGEVATLQRGFDLPNQHRLEGAIPIYAANGPVGFHNEMRVAGPGVVTGRSGSIGKVHYVEGGYWPLNTSLYVKDFHGNDPKYIYWLLRDLHLERFHHGTGVPTLNRNVVHRELVPVPPLPEQRRIAAILDKADALRVKRREAIAKLDQLLQSVFLGMFGDPVTNPKGWPTVKLAELGEWSSGGTPPRLDATNFEGDIPWYSSGELNSVYVRKSDECISPSAIKNSAAKIMRPGSLMVGMYDTAAFKSSITTVPAACNQAIAFSYLREEKCESIYVYQALQLGKEHFKRMQRGVRQKNLNLSLIRDTQIAHPPLVEQREFSSIFRAIHTQIESHMQFELMMGGLFAALQKQVFTGAI